jgi:anti-sigma-K factor RskA
MNCPINSGDGEHLLDYAAGKLTGEPRARMELHIANCPDCREFAGGQQTVWQALDAWEPAAVSMDFDRRLYQRIEQKATWWSRITGSLNPLFRHALTIAAAAGVLVVAGLLMNRPSASPVPPVEQSAQVESLTPDQMQAALDDMEMLREFNHLVPGHESKM